MQKRVYWVETKTRRQKIVRLLNIALVLFLGGTIAAVLTVYLTFRILSNDLPQMATVGDYRPNLITYVYDKDERIVGEFFYENQRRILLEYDQVPELVIQAIVSAEDAAFWRHEGLDYMGMVRATLVNLKTRKWSQGGSTITQQVTRSLLLSKEKKLTRKLKEMILSHRIEQKLSKQDILLLYLNEIYFGNGAYGIQAAAQNYFSKDAKDLTLNEASLLAGLPQAPSRFSPYKNKLQTRARQKYVLQQMVKENHITQSEADTTLATPWNLKRREDINLKYAPYFVEQVRKYVMGKYGKDRVLKEGMRIYTTLDTDLQIAADAAVDKGLRALDKRHGWRGPVRQLQPEQVKPLLLKLQRSQKASVTKGAVLKGVVTAVNQISATINVGPTVGTLPMAGAKWINLTSRGRYKPTSQRKNLNQILSVNDLIEVRVETDEAVPTFALEQPPAAQAALLAMEPATRYVRAVVGGRSYSESSFNRATQAKRQPGSSFKPIVYAAALDSGMTPGTVIMDTALVFKDGWKPGNYDGKFKGQMTLRQALAKSINTITIRIVDRISYDFVYRYAHRLGIRDLTGADLSMALGTYEVSPIQLINAYAVFASGGILAEPIFVKRVTSTEGFILEETILPTRASPAPKMRNVPNVSDWGKKVDLEQGSFEHATLVDPAAKVQFYNDFGIEGATKKKPPSLFELPETPAESYQRRVIFTQVISPQTAYLITSMMHTVASSGTGARSNVLKKIVAGKTGTTNDYVDAWFIGFSPDLLAGVWVGNDKGSRPLGKSESGSKAALPIWIDFMKEALKNQPVKDFKVPKGITVTKIDPQNGLLAHPDTPKAYREYFKTGTQPVEYTPKIDDVNEMDFFEIDLE